MKRHKGVCGASGLTIEVHHEVKKYTCSVCSRRLKLQFLHYIGKLGWQQLKTWRGILPMHGSQVVLAKVVKKKRGVILSEKQLTEIGRLYATKRFTQSRIAKKFGINPARVSQIVRRQKGLC